MAQFMLLLHEHPEIESESASPEQIQSIIAEYVAWREGLAAKNQLIGGEKLADEGGRILRRVDGKVQVTDGPYAEAKEIMGGYFAIEAQDYSAAVEIAQSCPHLKYGSRIELRQIDQVHV